jgi:hypothetical protein
MRRGTQRPHMDVEFVGQDLKRQSILLWPFRVERLGSSDNCRWRGPAAGIPRAECFDRDTKGSSTFRLGQAGSCSNLSQDRSGLRHRSRRCHRFAAAPIVCRVWRATSLGC